MTDMDDEDNNDNEENKTITGSVCFRLHRLENTCTICICFAQEYEKYKSKVQLFLPQQLAIYQEKQPF